MSALAAKLIVGALDALHGSLAGPPRDPDLCADCDSPAEYDCGECGTPLCPEHQNCCCPTPSHPDEDPRDPYDVLVERREIASECARLYGE
jgi:predicted amidophosphoribosyltransferase